MHYRPYRIEAHFFGEDALLNAFFEYTLFASARCVDRLGFINQGKFHWSASTVVIVFTVFFIAISHALITVLFGVGGPDSSILSSQNIPLIQIKFRKLYCE